jgi:hypothetical protein
MSLLQFTQKLVNPTAAPVIGQREFDGASMYETPYVGGRTAVVMQHYIRQVSNFTLQNVNTAQQAFSVTGATNGTLTLPGNTGYQFDAIYLITNTGTTSHQWGVLFGGTATLTSGTMVTAGQSAASSAPAAGSFQGFTSTLGTSLVSTPASLSATENVCIFIEGMLVTNAGGTFIPQLQLSAAPGGTQTMLAGSFFSIWPIGIDSVPFVGQWS